MNRRAFLSLASAGPLLAGARRKSSTERPPNIVLILADDLGYGDLGCYGSRLNTPHLDSLAAEGMRFTDFTAGASVCSPSRASLLTGRYATRCGVAGVLQPNDRLGLPASETTLAAALRPAGYRTAAIGKWHLGSQPEFLPINRGFDETFGIPYSNDMWPLPLLRNGRVIEETASLDSLTSRYTEEAVAFLRRNRETPFFLYLSHSSPHIPLATAERFRGKSPLGPYGDAVEELDWSAGEVLRTLKEEGLEQNTLVIFTSDNGPWYQGSAGRLRGRKGDTFEGGFRAPLLARLPRAIPAGRESHAMASALDLFPTLLHAAGVSAPAQRLDGVNLWPVLTGERDWVDHDVFLYFSGWDLQAARWNQWKLHVARYPRAAWNPDPPGGAVNLPLVSPELYNVELDPEESYDCSRDRADIVAHIQWRLRTLLATFPEAVQNAWRDTQNRPVESVPAGAYPILKRT